MFSFFKRRFDVKRTISPAASSFFETLEGRQMFSATGIMPVVGPVGPIAVVISPVNSAAPTSQSSAAPAAPTTATTHAPVTNLTPIENGGYGIGTAGPFRKELPGGGDPSDGGNEGVWVASK